MSFETHIADHLLTLKQDRLKLIGERLNMFHDCDCEYCDIDGLRDEYTDKDLEAMDKRVEEVDVMIRRIKEHAKLHRIEIPAERAKS